MIFEEPKMTIVTFEAEDVITASMGGDGSGGDGNTGGELFD